jgi:hypothetical protein
VPAVAVVLLVWEGPGVYTDEVYDFVANRDTLWSPVTFRKQRVHINRVASPDPNVSMATMGGLIIGTHPPGRRR